MTWPWLLWAHKYEVILEPGQRLLLGVQSINEPDERGFRTVKCTVNGQLRPVRGRDESVAVDVRQAETADLSAAGQVAAPFAGIVSLGVEVERLQSAHRNRSRGADLLIVVA